VRYEGGDVGAGGGGVWVIMLRGGSGWGSGELRCLRVDGEGKGSPIWESDVVEFAQPVCLQSSCV